MHEHKIVSTLSVSEDTKVSMCECGATFLNGEVTDSHMSELIKALFSLAVRNKAPVGVTKAIEAVKAYSKEFGTTQEINLKVFEICMQSLQ